MSHLNTPPSPQTTVILSGAEGLFLLKIEVKLSGAEVSETPKYPFENLQIPSVSSTPFVQP